MNSIWNKNISLFKERFPSLFSLLSKEIAAFEAGAAKPSLLIEQAKDGSPTASDASVEPPLLLHSKYSPLREATTLCAKSPKESDCAVFFGFGLGYAPLAFTKAFPRMPLILVEPNPLYLLASFSALDWELVLRAESVIFAIAATEEEVCALLAKYCGEKPFMLLQRAFMAHNTTYFENVLALWKKHKQKEEINTNTLERFGHLWLKNSCRNLHFLGELDGVSRYFGLVEELSAELPFVVIAAGPSLSRILPFIKEIKKRAIIVCVDTALHALLRQNIEPDFVVLVDPQYACARHLDFLQSPNSVLITESAAWPSVFRFKCAEVILCSSLFPIGQYFEKHLGKKGELGAGGSVSTTAWDFARKCGANRIFIAGMDLGFPFKQTHIRGSQFEERTHRTSYRTHNAETSGVSALLGAAPSVAKNFLGENLITDKRMSLFAWWFEDSCAKAALDGQNTFTLTAESMAISGIQIADVRSFLQEEDRTRQREEFFAKARARASAKKQGSLSFNEALSNFTKELEEIRDEAKRARGLCNKALSNRLKAPALLAQLSDIDQKILKSEGKEAASLVFPTERKLKLLTADITGDAVTRSVLFSKVVYSELIKATDEYLQFLR